MSLMTWRKAAVYALVALPTMGLAGVSFSAQQQQQQQQDPSQQSTGDPVADAARKAREQKKKQEAVKPKRVYTDEDVNHSVPEAPGTAEADGRAKTSVAQAGPGTAKPEDNPETMWRKRFKEAYANLARAEKELDVLQREDNKAQTQYYSDPQKALAEQYTRKEINEKDTKIAAKKKEVEQLKQQISDMQEELRKSGGDSGWAAP